MSAVLRNAHVQAGAYMLMVILALGSTFAVSTQLVRAAQSWSLSASPTTVPQGVSTTVRFTVTNTSTTTNSEEDIGCVIISIPGPATVSARSIVSTTNPPWSISSTNGSPATVRVQAGGDAEELRGSPINDQVVFDVTVTSNGSGPWVANEYEQHDCSNNHNQPISGAVSTVANAAPSGSADSYAVPKNTVLSQPAPGVLANDTDADGDPLTAGLVSGPTVGALTLNADGSFDFTPPNGFVGDATFTYRASDGSVQSADTLVTITVSNAAPVASADPGYATPWYTTLNEPAPGVLGNDTDADGDPLTASLVTPPASGLLTLNADGSFDYTPLPGFLGSVTFEYEASDGIDTSGATLVTITVTNTAPVGLADAYVVAEDDVLTVGVPGVLANDTDPEGDPLTASLVSGPSDGTLVLNADGSFTYTPDPDFDGPDSFAYRAYDGDSWSADTLVVLTVTAENDPPTAEDDAYETSEDTVLSVDPPGVLANDTDADGDPLIAVVATPPAKGSLTVNPDGSFDYVPDPDFHGTDSFTYRAKDLLTWSEATVTLTVTPVNDPPVAADDVATTPHATPITVDVLANDTDVDDDPLLLSVGTPSSGSATVVDGKVRYVPGSGTVGVVMVPYTVSDGSESDSAVLRVTVLAPLPTPSPTPTPTPKPSATPLPTPDPTPVPTPEPPAPTPTPAATAEPTVSESPSATPEASATPAPSTPPASSPPEAPGLAPLPAPQVTMSGTSGGDGIGDFGGLFGGFGQGFSWAVPAAALGVPGLLFIIVVAVQVTGAAAWIPAVRRSLGGIGAGRRRRSTNAVDAA